MAGKLNPKIKQLFWLKFTNWCHQAVILGYKRMLEAPVLYREMEEEDISALLYLSIEELPFIKSKRIDVFPEFRLYNKSIATGNTNAKNSDRIDFIFTRWKSKTRNKYFGEAKNLSLKTWNKAGGSKVNASQYRTRYIETGIDRIVSGKYSSLNSFLIGYVVNGSAKDNVKSLNTLIKKNKLPPKTGIIENPIPICSYPACYSSKNMNDSKEITLQHIFLEYDH